MTTYRLSGVIVGDLWWPRVPAAKPVEFRWSAACATPSEFNPCTCGALHFDSLRNATDALMQAEDADFSTAALLTADSMLVVERYGRHGQQHVHYREVSALPSIADYVGGAFASDFLGDEF